ncbi:MAG TPA: hypothetical protein VM925_16960, partial [Labilithrix sp.]|nr:hypothetical protein [Labilithrix sp.]
MSPMLERWLRELRRHHLDTEVDASLGSLTVQIDGGTASVGRTRGVPLFSSPPVQVETARVEPGIYGGTPTSEARVRLLAAAAAFGRRVLVHAPTVTDGTYRGRLAIDLPRRAMHALGRSTAEPGDRFDERFVHTFFDDEPIIGEARRANLAFVGRERGWIILEQSIGRPEERAESFALELMRALRFVRAAEHLRRVTNPEHAVMTMRARGERTK